MKNKKNPPSGFTMIILLVALAIFALLTVYAMERTLKRVNKNIEENNSDMPSVPAPTVQNYQQTLDNVKEKVNDDFQKEQQKLNDAQEQMSK